MILTQNNNSARSAMDNVPQQKDDKKGTVRDIIASKVGIGSGRTYERAKSAIKIIEKPFFPHEEQDNAILHRLIAAKGYPRSVTLIMYCLLQVENSTLVEPEINELWT